MGNSIVMLSQEGTTTFKAAVAAGVSTGQGLYGNPQVLGTVQPAWTEPASESDSAYFESTIDGVDIKVYAPYNFDLSLTQTNLVIVEALRDNDKYDVKKGKRKFSVRAM